MAGKKRLITWIENSMRGRESMSSEQIMEVMADKYPKYSATTHEISQKLARGKQFVKMGFVRKKTLWSLGELDE